MKLIKDNNYGQSITLVNNLGKHFDRMIVRANDGILMK